MTIMCVYVCVCVCVCVFVCVCVCVLRFPMLCYLCAAGCIKKKWAWNVRESSVKCLCVHLFAHVE